MRLLKIGRDASCNIVLHSDKVSSLHAEMTVLNNGDILLEDKNSRNGTFLMNQPIKSGTSVSVKRGDAIRFGDVELMWNQIPMQEDNSNYKALFGIGSNFRNEIQISGNTVSRFHATLKIGKDGKAYIQDHSKNGTTVNGLKVMFGQNVRIKRSDAIACGGVPVELKQFMPGPKVLTKLIGAIAVAAILVGVAFGVKHFMDGGKPSIKALEKATVCVLGQYYIEVTLEDDPFTNLIKVWPKTWKFGLYEFSKGEWRIALETFSNIEVSPISYSGTAFFLSENGELGTNRHIALPWEYLPENQIEAIRQQLQNALTHNNTNLVDLLQDAINEGYLNTTNANSYLDRLRKSPIKKITGSRTFFGVALTGTNIGSIADYKACQMIAESGDSKKDVALLRLNDPKTPEHIIKGGYFDIENAHMDESTLIPQEKTLITMGYPGSFTLGFFTADGRELLPTVHKVSISKTPDDNQFQFQGVGVHGASGSPIIDAKNHHLVGVLCSGFEGTDFSYGCNIKHLVELYNKHKVKK